MPYISIDKAVELLQAGETVAFPTETVYGLGADAWNPTAIRKVFEIKGRPTDNPLIVHIASRQMVRDFTDTAPEEAEKLMEELWPGPLTLIFKKKSEVLDLVTGGLDTVALRWPNHPLSQELIFRAGPLVAPSANISGHPSPTKAEHVKDDFGSDFPVIDGGSTRIGLESTVVDVTSKPLVIYRPGYISLQQIENISGKEVVRYTESDNSETRSPGTRYSHYSPRAAVRWLEKEEQPDREDALYLLHTLEAESSDRLVHYRGDYHRLAGELYDRFREADHRELRTVIIEPLPEPGSGDGESPEGILEALQNRIVKAIGR